MGKAFALIQSWNKATAAVMSQVMSEQRDLPQPDQLEVDADKNVV